MQKSLCPLGARPPARGQTLPWLLTLLAEAPVLCLSLRAPPGARRVPRRQHTAGRGLCPSGPSHRTLFQAAATCKLHCLLPPLSGRHPAWGHSSHPGICTAAGTRLRGGATSSRAGLLLSTRWEGLRLRSPLPSACVAF